jgi:hypothetical protein
MRSLKDQTFLQRVMGQRPKENAFVEINNLFAQRPVRSVSISDIEKIAESYNVNVFKKFQVSLAGLYRDYLVQCLSDKVLTNEEIKDLLHLKHALGLNDKIITKIHGEVTESIYSKSVDEAIADGRLDPDEKAFLDKLQEELKLPQEIAQRIYSTKAKEYLDRYFKSAVSDERLSPQEDEEIAAIAKSLGVQISYDEKTKSALDKYRLYWLIENDEIPELPVDINLQRKEKCYFSTEAGWHEYRRVTRRIRYGGPTARLRIAKGIYWRMGDLGVQAVSDDVLTPIGNGDLFLTNKRLIFMGSRKNTTIPLSKILGFTPYKNGVAIQKSSGKSPFLEFQQGIDIFSMMLGRAMKDLA